MKDPTFIDGLPDEATAAKALSHPLRRQLLDALHDRGEMSSRQLSELSGVEVQRINHHLRTLHQTRFVEIGEVRRTRNIVEHVYRALLQARVEVWRAGDHPAAAG